MWEKYQGHGVQILAVHCSDTDPTAWLSGHGVTFPVVQSNPGDICGLWDYDAPPKGYIIRRNTIIEKFLPGYYDNDAYVEGLLLDVIWMRDPVDIEMVMDISGSMNNPTSGDSKLTMMQRAATIVTDYLEDNGQTDDRMGLIWFESDVSEYQVGSDKLFPVPGNATTLRSQINGNPGSNGCTAMGGGLQTAFNTLGDDGVSDRFAILLTDGMQNVDPLVTKVGGHYEINDGGGWCAPQCGVAPSNIDVTTYDTRVHTIGVGILSSYTTLLQEVADQTEGFYLGTNDPDTDLDLLYLVDLCHCMAGGSPAVSFHCLGTLYEEKCFAEEFFYVNRSTRKITVILNWQQAQQCSLTFWIYDPAGNLVNLHREMKYYQDHCLATIYMPANFKTDQWEHVGQWRMLIRGEMVQGKADFHAFVVSEDRDVKLTLDYPRKAYEVGDILPLKAAFKEFDNPVYKFNDICVEISRPKVVITELIARFKSSSFNLDDKVSPQLKNPLVRKITAMSADKKYNKLMRPQRENLCMTNGELECKIDNGYVLMPIELKQPGLHTFKVNVTCESENNGPITRTVVASVIVGPGKISARKSKVAEMPLRFKKRQGVILLVTPRSDSGFLVGPGFGDEFEVKSDRKKLKVEAKDLVNGTYEIEITASLKKTTTTRRNMLSLYFRGVRIWKKSI